MDYADFTILLSSPVAEEGVLRFSIQLPVAGSGAPVLEPMASRLELHAIQAVLEGDPSGPPSMDRVLTCGRVLGDALFPSAVLARFRQALAFERARGAGLRIRILGNEVFQGIPWEYAVPAPEHGEATVADVVALSPDVVIARQPEGLAATTEPEATSWPLEILATAAQPADRAPIDVHREREELDAALRGSPQLVVRWTDHGAKPDSSRDRRARIYHFAGHGDLVGEASDAGPAATGRTRDVELDHIAHPLVGHGVVVFEDVGGGDDIVDGGALGITLRELGITTAVINACRSAQRVSSRAWSSVAAALMVSGIDSVVAMQHAILDTSALAFSSANPTPTASSSVSTGIRTCSSVKRSASTSATTLSPSSSATSSGASSIRTDHADPSYLVARGVGRRRDGAGVGPVSTVDVAHRAQVGGVHRCRSDRSHRVLRDVSGDADLVARGPEALHRSERGERSVPSGRHG
jgi:CHAT domain